MIAALTTDTHFGIGPKTEAILEKFLKRLVIENFDVLIHTGDWISHRQSQMRAVFRLFRKYVKDKPILTILGNHCLWDDESWGPNNKRAYKKTLTYELMRAQQRQWMKEFDIDYLSDNGPYIFEDHVIIYGFDGWYGFLPPPSNDCNYMPQFIKNCPAGQYLNYKSWKALDAILLDLDRVKSEKSYLKTVCITHHAPYSFDERYLGMTASPRVLEAVSEKFDYFFVGHSHKDEDWMKGSCRIVNAGSDYNLPNYKLIEIPNAKDDNAYNR